MQDVMVCKESPNASSSSQQHLWWQLWRRTAGCGAKNEANGYQPRAGRRSSQQTSTSEQLRQCGSHCGVAGTFQHGTACDARRCACSCRVCWANTRRLIAWRVRASTCVCVQLARDAGEQLLRWVVHVWFSQGQLDLIILGYRLSVMETARRQILYPDAVAGAELLGSDLCGR